MKIAPRICVLGLLAIAMETASFAAPRPSFGDARTIFETTSPYHHIRVIDESWGRVLCFDDAEETRMSREDPLQGHFDYTEYFHMPWLWKTNIASVLMIGLGGGSAQRSFEHYYTNVSIETVEIDPTVLEVARTYFHFKESNRQKVHLEDGRLFLRRNTNRYDLIILDAYIQSRYGSSIPQHLATREFFELASTHLSSNGVIACNIIGDVRTRGPQIVGAIYKTLNAVFPQVYTLPADTSQNVVLIATKATLRTELPLLRPRAQELVRSKRVLLPGFLSRVERLRTQPPASVARSPVLTDDYAPVEGLSAPGSN